MEDIHIHHLTGSTLRYADRYAGAGCTGLVGKGRTDFHQCDPQEKTAGQRQEPSGTLHSITLSITCESCAFLAGEPESCLRDIRIRGPAHDF